jgi:hypothetical protein
MLQKYVQNDAAYFAVWYLSYMGLNMA